MRWMYVSQQKRVIPFLILGTYDIHCITVSLLTTYITLYNSSISLYLHVYYTDRRV